MAEIGFKGGEALQAKLQELAAKLGRADQVRVGFLEGATYPDGTSVALVAATDEFGSPAHGQPPRPYFRNMIAEKGPTWGGAVAALMKSEDYDAAVVLGKIGEGIKGQLQQSIVDLTSPPLAPSTIARKGFDKPLIDKSVMLNSVDYEVKE